MAAPAAAVYEEDLGLRVPVLVPPAKAEGPGLPLGFPSEPIAEGRRSDRCAPAGAEARGAVRG